MLREKSPRHFLPECDQEGHRQGLSATTHQTFTKPSSLNLCFKPSFHFCQEWLHQGLLQWKENMFSTEAVSAEAERNRALLWNIPMGDQV